MSFMFRSSYNLATIYVSNYWNTDNVTDSRNMFYDCFSLVGGLGTAYDVNHLDAAYAHIDGGPDNPGYFSPFVLERGDLNGDGTVDIADAVSILNLMAESTYVKVADLNNDDKVDIADFVSILNIMAEN